MNKLCFIAIICLLSFACSIRSNLEEVLQLAGDNRDELEKVIAYYSENAEDSLKLKAALFLIENMPNHISYRQTDTKAYYGSLDELMKKKSSSNLQDSVQYVIGQYLGIEPYEDIKIIDHAYLISNIEQAFTLWRDKDWARHLSFDQFCEYLLPYKYSEYQNLDYWRDTLYTRFNLAISQLPQNDEISHNSYHIGREFQKAFLKNQKPNVVANNTILFNETNPFFSSQTIYRMPFGDCNDYSFALVAGLRSNGIPSVYEYMPQWGEKASGRHGWATIFNNNKTHLPIPYIEQSPTTAFFPTRKIAKIYRYSYAHIPERKEYLFKSKFIYDPLTLFDKDVTSEYVKTSDIGVPVKTNELKDKYVYIAVSYFRDWHIVDFGIVKRGKAHFANMGRGIVYIIMGFDGTSIVPISAPFLLTMEGETKPFIPNQDQREQITFFRKYPKSLGTAEMEARIIGGQVQSSHYPDFREAVTHYEISDPAYPDLIQIESNSAYRYWRYLGPPKSYCNIAEFQLFSNDSLMRGTIIGTVGLWKGQTYYSQPFDNDYLTYYHSAEDQKNEAWVGLDFGVPVSVNHVRCVPRSDGNAIQYGDTYELNYWHENKWTPLGTQEARDKNVSFHSVPRNALLLLKNLTRGQEERIFMYENNKQVWL